MIRGGAHAFRNPPLWSPITSPGHLVAVDLQHPLAAGLLMAFNFAAAREELLTRAPPSVNTVNQVGAPGAPALLNSGSQAGLRYPVQSRFHGLSRVSSFAWISLTTVSVPGTAQSVVRADGTFTPLQWNNIGAGTLRSVIWVGGAQLSNPNPVMQDGAVAGEMFGFGARWLSGSTHDNWTRFRGMVVGTGPHTGTIAAGSNPLCFTATEAGGENATQVRVMAFYAWDRYLNAEEFQHLNNNPYAFLIPRG